MWLAQYPHILIFMAFIYTYYLEEITIYYLNSLLLIWMNTIEFNVGIRTIPLLSVKFKVSHPHSEFCYILVHM